MPDASRVAHEQTAAESRAVLHEELSAAVEAARAAGAAMQRMRAEGVKVERKANNDLVTDADRHVAEMLHAGLAARFPGTGWLSEEHPDSTARLACERTWIVDPIDGTGEYVDGIPEYAVSIALVIAGQPALGVVFNPATDELFAAAVDPTREIPYPFAPASMKEFRALVGRSESQWATGTSVVQSGAPPTMAGARPRVVGSRPYRLALISSGQADLLMTSQPRHEWDIAAGVALCLASGVRVTDLQRTAPRFNKPDPVVNGLIVAAPSLHAEFVQHVPLRPLRSTSP